MQRLRGDKQPVREVPRGLLLLWAAALGAVVAVLGMELIPSARAQVGPTSISAAARTGTGDTQLFIPPLGAVEADTHLGPLSVRLSLREVDVPGLTRSLQSDPTGTELAKELEGGLRDLVVRLGVRVLIGGLFLGAVVLALLPNRRWPYVLAGGAGGLVAATSLVALAGVSFKVEAFNEPHFTGALTRAPVVIEAVQNNEIDFGEVEGRFATAADRLTELLSLINEPNLDPRSDTVAFLHISDVHTNPIGLEIARQLAARFEVDAVIDTGDLTNFGVSVEERVTTLIKRFDVPYVFVPGNHDADGVVRAMQTLEDVYVLSGTSTEIEGIEILGFRDPTYTNWNSIPPKEAAAIRREYAATVAERVGQSEPDVLAVHDARIAQQSFGLVPLILSGHYHRQIIEESFGTRNLAVGTTGAAGLKSFALETDQNYEAQIVYFREGTAVAIDYIRFTGLGANFDISRISLDELGPLGEPDEDDEVEDADEAEDAEGTEGEGDPSPSPEQGEPSPSATP